MKVYTLTVDEVLLGLFLSADAAKTASSTKGDWVEHIPRKTHFDVLRTDRTWLLASDSGLYVVEEWEVEPGNNVHYDKEMPGGRSP